MIRNFCLITYSFEGAAIAKKWQDRIGTDGEVIVGVIEDTKDIYLPMEIDAMKAEGKDPSKEDNKKERLNMYDGILRVFSAESVIEYLKKQEDKESWFVFTDMNYCFKFAEKAAEFMPFGNFPTAEHRALEVDRNAAKKFIEENYPDVAKDTHWEFKTVDEALKFLDTLDELVVLKGDGVDAPTVVPPTDDVETAREILTEALENNKDSYNAGGLIFEVKLDDAIELTPEKVYYDGEEAYTTIDIETKRKYAGDVGGELVGCGTDLVFQTDMEDKINKIAFPKIVDDMAKKAKGMFIWDISLLISKRSGKMYPGEFCANRPGWNAFDTEVEGLDIVKFFNDLVEIKNPIKGKKFSSSLRVFNDESEMENIKIIYPEEMEPHVWLIDAKYDEEGCCVTAGYLADVGIVTGHGDDFMSSVDTLYENVRKFALATKRWGYRSKGDYLDTTYHSSIVNRYNYAVQKNLISGYDAYLGGKDKSIADLESEHEDKIQRLRSEGNQRVKKVRDEIKTILES